MVATVATVVMEAAAEVGKVVMGFVWWSVVWLEKHFDFSVW